MDNNLRSLIDHILVNNSAQNDITNTEADQFTPGASSTFANWRQTFGDHVTRSFMLNIKTDTEVDFEDCLAANQHLMRATMSRSRELFEVTPHQPVQFSGSTSYNWEQLNLCAC